MRRALALIVLGLSLAACGSGGAAAPSPPATPASPDGSAAARAIDAWCAARQAEVVPAEIAAIRGREQRQRARMAKLLREADEDSDPYAVANEGVKAMFREEGLMLQMPLPGDIGELLRRLHALPEDSAARAWGERLASLREEFRSIDAGLKKGDSDALKRMDGLEAKYGKSDTLVRDAALAGVAACGRMALNPSEARIYAEIALAGTAGGGDVGQMVKALRRREPWLSVQAVPGPCALPADQGRSGYAAGVWKDTGGTAGVTVSGFEDGGTLARTASGETWKAFTVKLTAGGGPQRVGTCTP